MRIRNGKAGIVAFAALILLAGCSATGPGAGNFPNVVEITGCLERAVEDPDPAYACLAYEYDGEGVLTLQHNNTCFNCCPVGFGGLVSVDGNAIVIDEVEAEGQCDCLCLFDIEYRITGLGQGAYSLNINELYPGNSHVDFNVELDLSAEVSGEFCLSEAAIPGIEGER